MRSGYDVAECRTARRRQLHPQSEKHQTGNLRQQLDELLTRTSALESTTQTFAPAETSAPVQPQRAQQLEPSPDVEPVHQLALRPPGPTLVQPTSLSPAQLVQLFSSSSNDVGALPRNLHHVDRQLPVTARGPVLALAACVIAVVTVGTSIALVATDRAAAPDTMFAANDAPAAPAPPVAAVAAPPPADLADRLDRLSSLATPSAAAIAVEPAKPIEDVAPKPAPEPPPHELSALPIETSSNALDPLQRGQQLIHVGNIQAGRLLLERAAERGSAEAALVLGLTYSKVHGARDEDSNVDLARHWLRRAAAMGATEAEAKRRELGN